MKSIRLLLLPIALGLGISALSYAHPVHHSPLLKQLRHLDLNQTQKADVRVLLNQWKAEREVYAADKSALRHIIKAPSWDEQAARSILQQTANEDRAWLRAQRQQTIWNLLNEQQRQQWQATLDEESPRRERDPFSRRLIKRLDLSPEQQETLEELRSQAMEHKTQAQALRREFAAAQLQLMADDGFNQSRFLTLYQEYQPQFENLALEKMMQRHQFYHLLDDEQRQNLEQIRQKRRLREGKKHGRPRS